MSLIMYMKLQCGINWDWFDRVPRWYSGRESTRWWYWWQCWSSTKWCRRWYDQWAPRLVFIYLAKLVYIGPFTYYWVNLHCGLSQMVWSNRISLANACKLFNFWKIVVGTLLCVIITSALIILKKMDNKVSGSTRTKE